MHKRTLLIIEDEPDMLTLLQQRASMNNFYTELEQTGWHAVDTARKVKPDAIILDIHLPSVSGLDILKELKQDHELKKIPVVILTSNHESQTVKQAMALGANAYFTKTSDWKELFSILRNFFK